MAHPKGKLFAVTLVGVYINGTTFRSTYCRAYTEGQAIKWGNDAARELYPADNGYINWDCNVTEIPEDF